MTSGGEYSQVSHGEISRSKNERWWPRELGAWLISALMLVAIAIILGVFNGEAKPTIRWGITLNALIAILLKIGTSCLIVPLSAALGQWKWNRVGEERSLEEFGLISDASQSVWASIKLLFRFTGGPVAVIGATLVLCMQAIEPFVQQTVKYPSVDVPVHVQATLPVSYKLQFQTGQLINSPPDFGTKAGFLNGLFSDAPHTKYSVKPSCTGTNCTWPDYFTLGFCSSCVNLTDKVRTKTMDNKFPPETRYSLPSGLILVTPGSDDGGSHVYNASFIGGDFGDVDTLFNSFEINFLAALVVQNGNTIITTPSTVPVAGACSLKLCVRKFANASFYGGQLVENEIPSPTTGGDGVEVLQPPGTNMNHTAADVASWDGLSDWLQSSVSGTYLSTVAGETFSPSADARYAIYQAMTGVRGTMSLESLFENVANSLTQALRMANGPNNGVTNGTTYVTETVVRVDWAWMSLPFAVEALILLYLFAMMRSSRGTPPWRDQTLATLCHGLDERAMADVAALRSCTEMDRKAKTFQVRLVSGDSGSRLTRTSIPLT